MKAQRMYTEMVMRDRNRCALAFWGVANETAPYRSPQRLFLKSPCRALSRDGHYPSDNSSFRPAETKS